MGVIYKKSDLLTIIIIVYCWLLMANTSVADFNQYEYIFVSNDFRDLGFGGLCFLFRKIGLSILDLKMVLTGFSYVILGLFILKFTYYKSFIASIYLLFFEQLDVVQFRNFIAFSFVILGLYFIYSEGKWKRLKYIICIFVGATIHSMVIFFIILAFFNGAYLSSLRKFVKVGVPIAIVLTIVILLIPFDITNRIESYSRNTSIITKIMVFAIFIINIFIIKYISKTYKLNRTRLLSLPQQNLVFNSSQYILFLNISFIFILPFALNSLDYMRFFRFAGLMNCCYLSNLIALKTYRNQDLFLLFFYGALYLLLVYFMHIETFYNGIIYPLYNDNKYF